MEPTGATGRVHDPLEGLAPDGTIRTGADRDRIPAAFAPIVRAAVARVHRDHPDASVYLYGSVATGMATTPDSDVDLLTIGIGAADAAQLATELSDEVGDRTRGVEVGPAMSTDLRRADDEGYGFRVFLHHYCVLLAGPDLDEATEGFPGDRRAARGFNGDIAQHAARWRGQLPTTDPAELGRRIARKMLLAVAGLVSVRDGTWTTDRVRAARRWREFHPELAAEVDELAEWSSGVAVADRDGVARQLDGAVHAVVELFADEIGLWTTGTA